MGSSRPACPVAPSVSSFGKTTVAVGMGPPEMQLSQRRHPRSYRLTVPTGRHVPLHGTTRPVEGSENGRLGPEVEAIVMAQPKVIANLAGHQIVKVIHVGGRLVNNVVR